MAVEATLALFSEEYRCPKCGGIRTEFYTPEFRDMLCPPHRQQFMIEFSEILRDIAENCCEFCGRELLDCRCGEGSY